jgi:predicted ArsR family transcriptional regulator
MEGSNGVPAGDGGAHRRNGVDARWEGSLGRAILVRLRLDGPSSPDALATSLGVSRTGVLQQLRALEAAGLVTHAVERHGVGRPRHRYDVTTEAQDLFPSGYHTLAADLVDAIRAVGGDRLLDEVFASRRERLRQTIEDRLDAGERSDSVRADDGRPDGRDAVAGTAHGRPPLAPGLEARVRQLAVVQDQHGYLAEDLVGDDGLLRLRQHNCAIHQVASGEPAACRAELELYRELLHADVERETHIASGDRSCTYVIRPLED